MSGPESSTARPHTGRRRNELARRAVLEAALSLIDSDEPVALTMDAIARRAGVGKQTLYRWWPSKGAILLEALADIAAERVAPPDSGSATRDIEEFLVATTRQMREPRTARMLRRLAREAAVDEHAAELLRGFTHNRRRALHELLARHDEQAGTERDALKRNDPGVNLLIDQVYGALWYRLLLDHAALDDEVGRALARTLATQLDLSPDGADSQ